MQMNFSPKWGAGNLRRDTLVFALGTMGAAVLRRAMSKAKVVSRYSGWVSSLPRAECDDQVGVPLVRTGALGGRVTLIARPRQGEFYIDCEHSQFRALIALGFDVESLQMRGLLVASFEGDEAAASAFALSLERRISDDGEAERRDSVPQSVPSFQKPLC